MSSLPLWKIQQILVRTLWWWSRIVLHSISMGKKCMEMLPSGLRHKAEQGDRHYTDSSGRASGFFCINL